MKKAAIIFFLASMFLCGCVSREYTFPNKDQPIESVEMLYNPHANNGNIGGDMEILRSLTIEEAYSLLQALYKLETGRCTTPPPTGYGFYVIRVTYTNGDVEIFGSRHIEFIENGDEPKWIGSYYFPGDAFLDLFSQYVEIEE